MSRTTIKAKPALPHPELLENVVIERIRSKDNRSTMLTGLIEAVYGWIYVGWVRRSFISAALAIFAVFVYQQANILRSVRSLQKEVVSIRSGQPSVNVRDLERKLTLFKISS
ncbi:MAG: hypothetical protein GX431_03545, partial [Bacteroidales bacterium]|nr:hypothetical protein [Bacteroidales bacterium]